MKTIPPPIEESIFPSLKTSEAPVPDMLYLSKVRVSVSQGPYIYHYYSRAMEKGDHISRGLAPCRAEFEKLLHHIAVRFSITDQNIEAGFYASADWLKSRANKDWYAFRLPDLYTFFGRLAFFASSIAFIDTNDYLRSYRM